MKNAGSAARQHTNRQANKENVRRSSAYVTGSAVRKLAPAPEREEHRKQQNRQRIRKNREKASYMSIGYVTFMIAAIVVTCMILIGYVNLQSDITNRINNIAKLERQLNDMKLSNDEEYTRIMSNVDLDNIKRIAINELGMKYAKDGQVITYSGEGSDYVRQYNNIPD